MNWTDFMLTVILILLVAELGIIYYLVRYNSMFLKQIQSIKGIQFATLDIGEKAPLFRTFDENGRKVIAKQMFSEKNSLLLFIKTTCPKCKSLLPHLQKIVSHYDLNVVLVNSDETGNDDHITSTIPENIFYIRSPQIAQSYMVHTVPYAVVVNRNGDVELSHKINSANHLFNVLVNQESLVS